MQGVPIKQSSLQEIESSLKACDDVTLETIPEFVRCGFAAFHQSMKKSKTMQPKVANILYRQSSPRTKKVSPMFRTSMGELLVRELKCFQMDGILFGLEKNGRCLIGDEMGLGKTLQALGIISVYKDEWPALIICPSSIRFQWRDQCSRWLAHLFKNPKQEILTVKNGKFKSVPKEAKIVIASYEIVTKVACLHNPGTFNVVVCDESHYLKSSNSKRSHVIVPLLQSATRALLLSGTPALNKPSDLFMQINALLPDFVKLKPFSERYCEQRVNPWSRRREYYGSRLTDELNLLLRSTIMIRRLKKHVQSELPDKLRSRVPVEIASASYKDITSKMKQLKETLKRDDIIDEAPEETEQRRKEQKQSLMSSLFQLTGEAKAESVADYVDYLVESSTSKLIVFAHHRKVMDVLEARIRKKGVGYVRIDGSTNQNSREGLVKQFQDETNVHTQIALLSITACGHGLNLTAAGTAVFGELYWVPGQVLQAEDRCHRMGTKHTTVNIHFCIAEDTLDETVWRILNRKWTGLSSTLNGVLEEFRDDVDESFKAIGWKQAAAEQKPKPRQKTEMQQTTLNFAPSAGASSDSMFERDL